MKEHEIRLKSHIFKMLKKIDIDLIVIGFAYIDTDEEKWKKIKMARMILLDVFDEVRKELEELIKKGLLNNKNVGKK